MMKPLVLSIVFLAVSGATCLATETGYEARSIEEVVDELTLIDAPAPGIDGTSWFTAFMAEDQAARFAGRRSRIPHA
jgi:hypothetical protein